MKIIEKYTGEKVYMFPNGALGTKEAVLRDFPAALTFAHIVETDEAGEVMFALQNLSAMRSHYGIDKALTEEEAIAAIQEIVNTPPAESTTTSTEERTATALEAIAEGATSETTAKVAALEAENAALNAQLTDTQLALCELYEASLANNTTPTL